jgi:hypothetical protein
VARLFTAASSEIAANTTAAPLTAVPLTMAGWARLTALGSVTRIMCEIRDKDNGTSQRAGWRVEMNNNEQVVARSSSSNGSSSAAGGTMTPGVWHHVGGVFSSNASRIAYLDGTAGSAETTSRIPANVDCVLLGAGLISASTVNLPWDGGLIEWAIWNVALTADEMAMLAAGVHPRRIRPANLVWRQASDDQRHIVLDDVSGLHLTLSGTQYVPDIPPQLLARNPKRTARIYSFPSGASGTTVSVPAGSLTLTGYAPTVATTANQTIAVPSGTLTLTGNNPTVVASDHKTIAIPVGTLTHTGLDPTVTVSGAGSVTVAVPSGTLTLGGLAPTVIATGNITVEIPAGSLSLTGYAPTVLTPRLVEVPSGTLTLTGNNPTVITTSNQVLSIPSGTLTLTGFAPTVIGEVVSSNKGGFSGWTEFDYKLRQRLRKQALAQAALEDDEEALAILLATLLRR